MATLVAQNFGYRAPRSVAELLQILADTEGAKLLAGGTDLLVELRNGVSRPKQLVDLKRIEGLGEIRWDEAEGLSIGPAVTINQLLRSPIIAEHYPLLAACGRDLASHQIRNRATVIGNIVNASPCADMAPGLLCLQASAVIASTAGERVVPLGEFFTGVKRTVLAKEEFLSRVVVPAEAADGRGGYRKHKRIKGHDLGIVGVAMWKKDGELRLGISSAAPTPRVVTGLHENDESDAIVAAARAAISPISDVRCTAEYRTHLVQVFTRRLIQEVA